jgi:hypothetical protein
MFSNGKKVPPVKSVMCGEEDFQIGNVDYLHVPLPA